MPHEHYTYCVAWSPQDEAYVGTVVELPSLSCAAHNGLHAYIGIRALAAEVVEEMEASGETPPEPITEGT